MVSFSHHYFIGIIQVLSTCVIDYRSLGDLLGFETRVHMILEDKYPYPIQIKKIRDFTCRATTIIHFIIYKLYGEAGEHQ